MNAKSLTVVALFQAKPGRENELRAALIGLLAPTRTEAGCINYDLHSSPEDPAKFLFYENWIGKAALDAHMQSPHVQKLLPRVSELCVAFPEIKIWENIG
jgi:quinol monooxygenase YgiN